MNDRLQNLAQQNSYSQHSHLLYPTTSQHRHLQHPTTSQHPPLQHPATSDSTIRNTPATTRRHPHLHLPIWPSAPSSFDTSRSTLWVSPPPDDLITLDILPLPPPLTPRGRRRHLLLSVLPCLVAVLATPHLHMALLLAVWAVAGGVRWYSGDRRVAGDCFIFGGFAVWLARSAAVNLMKSWRVPVALPPLGAAGAGAPLVVLGLALALAYRTRAAPGLLLGRSAELKLPEGPTSKLPQGTTEWTLPHPKPAILPCRTKHARIFPKRHAFDYSYLQCGFPIVPAGMTPDGIDVGSDKDRRLGSWWLHIKADDYLSRGNGALGFYGKLAMFMREQHVADSEWSYAYLVTAPRFFGYAFNPVSFWYIYNQEHQLTKMILEVNNTFAERRIYLLNGSSPSSAPPTPGVDGVGPDLPNGLKARFTDLWMKDFHVSPFNSRKGSYSLKALNPFPYATFDAPTIDNTITLMSSKNHAKVVARLYSTGEPLDPGNLGLSGTIWFILSWWWVGFVTSPRILREAMKLFFKRSLHVWFRPEVLAPSLGRLPTTSEITIHAIFHDYLLHLVNQSTEAFRITLHTAIPDVPQQIIESTNTHGAPVRELVIRILTPAFYSRFVHYTYTSEAFDRECIFTDEKNRTLWISQPQLLPLLLSASRLHSPNHAAVHRSPLDKLRWNIPRWLRCPPVDPAYNPTPKTPNSQIDDIPALPFSSLDEFVRRPAGQVYAGVYRRAVTKLFLGQRVFAGFSEVASGVDVAVRMVLCYAGAQQLVGAQHGAGAWELLKPALAVSACHAYEFLKGYT